MKMKDNYRSPFQKESRINNFKHRKNILVSRDCNISLSQFNFYFQRWLRINRINGSIYKQRAMIEREAVIN